jgi:hypothetical protein
MSDALTAEIRLCTYDPLEEGAPVPETVIRIDQPLPALERMTPASVATFYAEEAGLLATALCASLPQGTLHQLLGILLARYATVYRGKTGD